MPRPTPVWASAAIHHASRCNPRGKPRTVIGVIFYHAGLGFGGGFGIHSVNRRVFSFDVAYGDAFLVYLTTKPLQAFVNQEKQL